MRNVINRYPDLFVAVICYKIDNIREKHCIYNNFIEAVNTEYNKYCKEFFETTGFKVMPVKKLYDKLDIIAQCTLPESPGSDKFIIKRWCKFFLHSGKTYVFYS